MAAVDGAGESVRVSRRVVDAPTRVLHAVLASSFALAWLTAEADGWRTVHVTLGYTAAAAVLLRLLWGVLGPRPARLLPRIRPAAGLVGAIGQMRERARGWHGRPGGEPRLAEAGLAAGSAGGASPAGGAGAAGRAGGATAGWRPGAMRLLGALHAATIAGLLGLTVLTVLAGWLNLQGAGGEAAEALHELLGNGMLVAVGVHLAGLIASSVLAGHNRLMTMLTGRLPGRGPDLAPRNHAGVALALLALVAAFWGWRAVQAPDPMVVAYEQQHERGEARGAQDGAHGDSDDDAHDGH